MGFCELGRHVQAGFRWCEMMPAKYPVKCRCGAVSAIGLCVCVRMYVFEGQHPSRAASLSSCRIVPYPC